MRDKALRNMSEADLQAALEPKVTGSVVLYKALQEEKLDFMLFFSSIQTFVGNAGQANYAAACAFKDAFAAYLSELGDFPVRIINWGYWGSVGVAATAEHNKRMAAAGLISIMPEEGMEAVKRIISQSCLEQVVVFKAEPHVLRMANIGISHKNDDKQQGTAAGGQITFAQEKSGKDYGRNQVPPPISAFDEADLQRYTQEKTVQCIATALKVECGEVDCEIQFSEYGVDSITGVELIKNIAETFDITLKTTVLFDYSNVNDLTAYLYNEYRSQIEQRFISEYRDGREEQSIKFGGSNNDLISNETNVKGAQADDYDNIELLEKLALGELDEDEVLKRIAN
jgi:acyl carrier protein